MPNNIIVYDLLISCPSDVAEYVDMLEWSRKLTPKMKKL